MDRVMKITGATTKTEAIHFALREVDRKAQLIDVLREGIGAAPDELRSMFDEASDPGALRVAETISLTKPPENPSSSRHQPPPC